MLAIPNSVFERMDQLMEDAESGQLPYEEAFRQVLELDPNAHLAMLGLGDVYQKNGDRAEAEKLYCRAVEVQPCASRPYLQLALLYREQPALAIGLSRLGLSKILLNSEVDEELEDPQSVVSLIVENAELPEDLNPEEKIQALVDEFGAAIEEEPGDVTERLRPLRLIHELQESSDLDREYVDKILAMGESIIPMLIGVLRGWVQGITNEDDDSSAGNAAALLGEIGDPRAIEPLIELSVWDNTSVSGPAGWAMRRIVERHPDEVAKVVQDIAPGLSPHQKVSAMTLILEHPEMPVSSELLVSVLQNLERAEPEDRDTALQILLTASIAILGIDFGRSMFQRYRHLMSRKARQECLDIIEEISAGPIPERSPAEPSPWSIYEVCGGEVDWQEEQDAEEEDLDDEYVPEPIRRTAKPGRNDPCWCGSGKKYKKCHLDADEMADRERGGE